MPALKRGLITAEQYRIMEPPADGSKVELVRGELKTILRPGFRHGYCQGRVASVLNAHGRTHRHGRAVVETGIVTERNPDTVRGPSASYWSAERLPFNESPQGYPHIAPDVAVEVLSPTNCIEQIREKMAEYFGCSVRMVWIVNPEERTVTVYRSLDEGRVFHESATLSGEDVLPGFTCKVADLFV